MLNYGIPISVNNLNKLSVYKLIELFLNIENDLDFLIEKYKKEQKRKVIIHENKKKIDLHLKNLINSFLKEFNIKNKNEGEKIFLDLSNIYLIENIQNKPLQILIRDYIKIKDSEKSDENLEKKINILSGLKNNADNYFVKNLDNFNEFIRINNSKLKGFWQAIGSHRSSTIKKNKYLDIKKEFDNLTIEEKHNKVNQILDAIIYIIFINNF